MWTNGGVLSPGTIGYHEGACPIHVVYSSGNHYDALYYSNDTSAMILAVCRLHDRILHNTNTNRAAVIDVEAESPIVQNGSLKVAGAEKSAAIATNALSKSKGKRTLESDANEVSKSSRLNEGVQKSRNIWRVGFRPRGLNNRELSRKTLPFDYSTEDEAKRVFQYFSHRREGNMDHQTFGVPSDHIQSIDAIVASLHAGTVDGVLNSLKATKAKVSNSAVIVREDAHYRGVSYDLNNVLVVRLRLPDVLRKLRVYKVPFRYAIAREAGLAYDYAITTLVKC